MSYMAFVKNISKSCNLVIGDIPLHFRPAVFGTSEDDFETFVIPGVMAVSLILTAGVVTGVSHVTERSEGILTRAKCAGLSRTNIICSNLIAQTFVAVIQLVVWNVVLHFVFHFVILGSPWLLTLFGFLVEMFGVALGLLLGQLFQNATQVLLMGIFLALFFILFGCAFLPVNLMDKLWQYFAYIVPSYLPTESMRSIVIRGKGVSHSTVWIGLVSTCVWIGVLLFFVIIADRAMRK